MKDKRLRDKSYIPSDQELRFTEEDRYEVFEQINKLETKHYKQKKSNTYSNKIAPLTASFLIIGLSIFLFIPSILPGNVNNNNTGSHTSGVISQEADYFTTLFMVRDKNNRIPINLLFTYSEDEKMMKVVSIPRDTYAPISDHDKNTPYDTLSHAYVNGSGGAKDVVTTVSELFDLSIDYYAVMDLETFSSMIHSVNGIDYELDEDIQVRAISQAVFELKKGTHRLNGEEVVALMMDADYGRNMDEEDRVNLIHSVMNQAINGLPRTQLKQIIAKIEGDIPMEQLLANKMEVPPIQAVSLFDGMIDSMIDEVYYVQFENDYLNSISEELTTFN